MQGMLTKCKSVAVGQHPIFGDLQTLMVRPGVSIERNLQLITHFGQRPNVIRVAVGQQNRDWSCINQHGLQRFWLSTKVDQHALAGCGANQRITIHWPRAN
jgi:hypothetical protein